VGRPTGNVGKVEPRQSVSRAAGATGLPVAVSLPGEHPLPHVLDYVTEPSIAYSFTISGCHAGWNVAHLSVNRNLVCGLVCYCLEAVPETIKSESWSLEAEFYQQSFEFETYRIFGRAEI